MQGNGMQEYESNMPMYNYMAQPKKMTVGERMGYFFLSLTPIAACIILQFICVFAVLVVALVAAMLMTPIDPTDMNAIMELYTEVALSSAPAGVLAYHVVGTLVFGLWYYLSFKRPRPRFTSSLRRLNGKNLLITVVCGVCLCFFANGTVCIESVVVPGIVEEYMEMAETAGLGSNVLAIIASIVLAPIGEEYVCRGLAMKYAKKCFGKFWIANLLQAFLFGLIHMNWVQGIYAFVIGLVLGWLTERYDTILPAILLHFVVNFSSSTWVPYVLTPLPMNMGVGLILTLVPVIIMAWLLIWGGEKEA